MKGKRKSALNFASKSLATFLSAVGEEHPTTAVAYTNLGSHISVDEQIVIDISSPGAAYDSNGKIKEALDCYEHSLSIRLRVFGRNHIDTAEAHYNLSFEIYKELVFNPSDRRCALYDSDKPAMARIHIRRAVDALERLLGPLHPRTQDARKCLEEFSS